MLLKNEASRKEANRPCKSGFEDKALSKAELERVNWRKV